ncbi:MAG: oxygen-dependent coproporphyrinogen oxidase, partial [Cytophagaceae bacterium]|nr:oxygen-dependent coproporphyrinogen oxidase [Cytophagaceae bacterium]
MAEKSTIEAWLKNLQDDICNGLEDIDQKSKFKEEVWERQGGGGGRSRVITEGEVFEKGGVNFSAVHGEMPDKILQALNLPKSNFYATGVSIVIHPVNPWVPIIHMNVRYFEMDSGIKWFGGGIDLTPHYIDWEDTVYFHKELKKACDKHSEKYYPQFKKWADDYFFIPHREETRGIGGIFFDRLTENENLPLHKIYEFIQEVGKSFLPIYTPLVLKNKQKEFTAKEKKWQHIRRGRYVEFNLVYDKGTKFGLDTQGRTESILMSLPPVA